MNIYLVRFRLGRLLVVVARTGHDAGTIAVNHIASKAMIEPTNVGEFEVGRIGTYGPGFLGRLAQQRWPILAEEAITPDDLLHTPHDPTAMGAAKP